MQPIFQRIFSNLKIGPDRYNIERKEYKVCDSNYINIWRFGY